ncbi:MAG: ADP-forming succinate--CoA ligase subunit beta [Euryarchaeota archaeon]|nr:ADP-forming succinate--CoA ligase subunit beta [Euryarchaeota archaeon]
MKVHEYQAKEIFKKYGVPVPDGALSRTPAEAKETARRIGAPVVVKAQVHAGGRGKGGGIKLAATPDDAESVARKILGMRLVTHQTGPEGTLVKSVLVERASDVEREMYLGMVIDRERSQVAVISSPEGGVEIESVALKSPEKVHKAWVDPLVGLMPYQARQICFGLGLAGQPFKDGVNCILNLYRLFVSEDATLAEINPLAVTRDGKLIAIDAKINLDDDAAFRHNDRPDYRDPNEEDPLEVEAKTHNLSYIKLSGTVGCMVNGAGLAMATMDLIKHCGGEPANFLDVGGAASSDAVEKAFKILTSDKDVRCVLINIFGGIVRCDRVATGVVEAIGKAGDAGMPIVVRLEGTNAKEGIDILRGSGLNFHTATGFHEAAQKAVDLSRGGA